MTYFEFIERNGMFESFGGTDDDLDAHGSFVLQSGGRQAVAKRQSNDTWRVWERVPVSPSNPLGAAKLGKLLGEARQRSDSPRVWSAHQRTDGTEAIADRPSPYGTESLGAAINELLRLGKSAT